MRSTLALGFVAAALTGMARFFINTPARWENHYLGWLIGLVVHVIVLVMGFCWTIVSDGLHPVYSE